MENSKKSRKDVKKAWLGIKVIIKMGDCTHSEMKQLLVAEKEFYNNLTQPSTEKADPADVMRRRRDYENSEDMQEIAHLFWFVLSQERDTVTNEITKHSFVQFNLRIQRFVMTGHEIVNISVIYIL
jgi:hypothetical protein